MIGGSPSVGSSPTFAGLTLTGVLLAPNGSATAPPYSFSSSGNSDNGLFLRINNEPSMAAAGTIAQSWTATLVGIWNRSFRLVDENGSNEVVIERDDLNILARRNSTAAQEDRLYGRFTSTSNYARRVVKWATTTLTAVTGASVTATGLVPARAQMLDGVISKVTTALGTTNSTTGYAVGTSGDPNQWGDIVGTATTTASGTANFTASPNLAFSTSAQDVVVTAAGGNFDGTGDIYLAVPYSLSEAD